MQYGLLGEHLPHSHSPEIHSFLGNSGYSLFEKTPDEVKDFLRERRFEGINVTIPYKETVMPLCDVIDGIAAEIGAVNTIVNCGGSLFGTNTDYSGFIFMCNYRGIDFSGRNVLILGSGGTSKMVQVAAKHLGAEKITVVSRSGTVNYDNVYELCEDTNIVVNTTPLGMYPNVEGKPLTLAGFPHLTGVADVVYNPLKTRLLQEAASLGVPHTDGLLMLVAQAAFADSFFRNKNHTGGRIVEIHDRIRLSLTNTVLIGMPGCGKSTVGKLLAKKSGREFYDIDAEVVSRAGKSIPEIFEDEGEKAFRDLESEVTKDLCKKCGVVIACGGGTVLREENRAALIQNGKIIYLVRETEKLSRGGRPLSSSDGALEKMYAERAPIYEALADVIIEPDDGASAVAAKAFSKVFEEQK